jgi:hypothetical protein
MLRQNKDYVPSKYRPVVKFRNIEKSVLQAIQTGGADDGLMPDVDVESDNEDEADNEPLGPGMDEGEPVAFEIDPDIDINSRALKDMVSIDPVSINLSLVSSRQPATTTATIDPVVDWNW